MIIILFENIDLYLPIRDRLRLVSERIRYARLRKSYTKYYVAKNFK